MFVYLHFRHFKAALINVPMMADYEVTHSDEPTEKYRPALHFPLQSSTKCFSVSQLIILVFQPVFLCYSRCSHQHCLQLR